MCLYFNRSTVSIGYCSCVTVIEPNDAFVIDALVNCNRSTVSFVTVAVVTVKKLNDVFL